MEEGKIELAVQGDRGILGSGTLVMCAPRDVPEGISGDNEGRDEESDGDGDCLCGDTVVRRVVEGGREDTAAAGEGEEDGSGGEGELTPQCISTSIILPAVFLTDTFSVQQKMDDYKINTHTMYGISGFKCKCVFLVNCKCFFPVCNDLKL